MVEYRPVPGDDVDAYRRVLDYAFRAEAGPEPEPSGDGEADPDAVVERRGLYEDGRLVTTGAHHQFTATVRGGWVEVAGLGGVATLPEARHRGLVRQLLHESLREYREWDRPFAILWPFKHDFYRRFGWGRLGSIGRYEFEPEAVSAVIDHPLAGGRFERLDEDDIAALQALDERYAEAYDLAIRRTEPWYRHRFFEGWQGRPFVYGWYADDELAGYLRYTVEETDGDRELRVSEFGATDAAARVNLLRFLHRHAAQTDQVRVYAPPDEVFFDLVADPRAIELTVVPGSMGRLVDVAAGLEALPAPAGVEASVPVEVHDGFAEWNDGTFVLNASGGTFAVEAGGDEARAALPIETLSRLAFGTATVERAGIAGGLEADADTSALLGSLFPPREVFLREFF